VTSLNPNIGYEKAAQISVKAYREHLTLRRRRSTWLRDRASSSIARSAREMVHAL
jgi:fumarate hydratase class II